MSPNRYSIIENYCTYQKHSSDATGSEGISGVTDGINNAQAGIATIAKALLTGQKAPADARQQVEDGLTSAGSALASINSYVLGSVRLLLLHSLTNAI